MRGEKLRENWGKMGGFWGPILLEGASRRG